MRYIIAAAVWLAFGTAIYPQAAEANKVHNQFTLPDDELDRRIARDFSKTLADILPEIKKYYPNVDAERIAGWEESRALECAMVGGEKRYFRNAAANLFRIDEEARKVKAAVDGRERASRDYIVSQQIRQILAARKSRNHLYLPHRWLMHFNITVDNDLNLERGEEVRIWLPYPSTRVPRQGDVKLESANSQLCLSDTAKNSVTPMYRGNTTTSAYTTISYTPDSTNRAAIAYSFTTHAEYHHLPKNFKHRPTNTRNPKTGPYIELGYQHEKANQHIRQLTKYIVGAEERPYYQARMIFEALREMYPWASAREYSTIEDIPQYVVENGHGDCGQITMLYIVMCRILNIPARWQSGFMLHPGYENLHDWCEIYIEGMGWIPVDPSFGVQKWGKTEEERYFYFGGIDAFRMIVQTDRARVLTPHKQHPRSDTVDFQRGEVETKEGNLYFDSWSWKMNSEILQH